MEQFSIRYNDLCRVCNHIAIGHSPRYSTDQDITAAAKINFQCPCRNSYCGCKCEVYVPSDNLIYLEWQSEKRNV